MNIPYVNITTVTTLASNSGNVVLYKQVTWSVGGLLTGIMQRGSNTSKLIKIVSLTRRGVLTFVLQHMVHL